ASFPFLLPSCHLFRCACQNVCITPRLDSHSHPPPCLRYPDKAPAGQNPHPSSFPAFPLPDPSMPSAPSRHIPAVFAFLQELDTAPVDLRGCQAPSVFFLHL